MPTYKEIYTKSACNKLKTSRFPFDLDLNIYRGCEHGCKYCYAIYSHDYLGDEKYYEDIYIKINIVEMLERELSKKKSKRKIINLGSVTDSYQQLENTYKLMPDILSLMIKYKNPCTISTKSDLILRDYELIEKLASITSVNIASTITSMDDDIQKKIEPNASSSMARFNMLEEFSKTNASTGLHFMPIIPYITDSKENIDALYSEAKKSKVSYVLSTTLNLRGKTRTVFFDFIKSEMPNLYAPLQKLYRIGEVDKTYKYELYKMVESLKNKYGILSNIKNTKEAPENNEPTLFDMNNFT